MRGKCRIEKEHFESPSFAGITLFRFNGYNLSQASSVAPRELFDFQLF